VLLNRPAILVVEDEPFIAMDVALAVEDAGGVVIGPAASVAEAIQLLQTCRAAGAILDVNVLDGEITPLVERLIGDDVPMVLQTGVGLPAALAARHPDLVVLIKPIVAAVLVSRLAIMLGKPAASGQNVLPSFQDGPPARARPASFGGKA